MTVSLVQRFASFTNSSGTLSQTVAVSAATAAGNTAVLVVKAASGKSVTGVTDTQGNTWTVDVVGGSVGVTANVCSALMAVALTTSDTITITFSATGMGATLGAAYEYSGIATSGRVDQTASAFSSSNGTLAAVGPTGTTTQASELAVTAVSANKAESGVTVSAGWTIEDSGQSAASSACLQVADQIVSSVQAFSATWTLPTSGGWAVAIATYKAAGGGSTTTPLTLSATSSSTATVVRRVAKSVNATSSSAVTIVRRVAKPLTATASHTVGLAKLTRRAFKASSTGTASLSTMRVVLLALSAVSTGSAKLTRRTLPRLVAASTGTVVLKRHTARILIATASHSVKLTKRAGKSLVTVSSGSASVVRRIAKRLSASSLAHAVLTTLKRVAGSKPPPVIYPTTATLATNPTLVALTSLATTATLKVESTTAAVTEYTSGAALTT